MVDDREAGRYWERNAAAWTRLARAGWDVYRDAVNTPAFFELLPDVAGKRGLDVGCGEGHHTRLLSGRGAHMCAIDIAPTFVRLAAAEAGLQNCPILHAVASAQALPFAAGAFDFAIAIMSLTDLPDQREALGEIHRVLVPGGFLQFSILHPCFSPPHRRLLRDRAGNAYALEVGRYFERVDGRVDRWLFSAAPPEAKAGVAPFEVPIFHRTLADWVNAAIETGFVIEAVAEPTVDEETARRVPGVADTRVAGYFLHLRCRKG